MKYHGVYGARQFTPGLDTVVREARRMYISLVKPSRVNLISQLPLDTNSHSIVQYTTCVLTLVSGDLVHRSSRSVLAFIMDQIVLHALGGDAGMHDA